MQIHLQRRTTGRAAQLLRRGRRRKAWQKVVMGLACIVVFCTTYALILPAITMEQTVELVCGLTEHIHDDACYVQLNDVTQTEGQEAQQVLICTLPVHVHTVDCLPAADPAQDVETEAQWVQTMPAALSGNWADDLILVAQSQLGYTESSRNYIVTADGLAKGYTRYGAWYGDPYGDWSAMFVSFCIRYAGISGMPLVGDAASWVQLLAAQGLYIPPAAYLPSAGELIFLDRSGDGVADHVGIVTGVGADGSIAMIEGDSMSQVRVTSCLLGDAAIVGYGKLPEPAEVGPCGQAEHTHDAGCYGADGRLLCALDEHTHTAACTAPVATFGMLRSSTSNSTYTTTKVNQVVTSDSTSKWATFEAAVANDKANKTVALSLVVYGGGSKTVSGVLTGSDNNQFLYWTAYVIEEDSDGYLKVKQILAADGTTSKANLKPSSTGFVLITYKTSTLASVGDNVAVNFDYKSSAAYKTNAKTQMSIVFIKQKGTQKTSTANTGLHELNTVSTRDFIELNLYDFGSGAGNSTRNINEMFKSDSNWPGFQQDGGAVMESTYTKFNNSGVTDVLNFGNNITSDLADGTSVVSNSMPYINRVTDNANKPISSVSGATNLMDKLLTTGGGYPSYSSGKYNLNWLFGKTYGGKKYSDKLNTQSIDRLFQYNETTGEYHFDSRTEFAQFNEDTDTFTVYDEILTPNFILYPFGNFMPLNNIVTQTTKMTSINRQYFVTMMNQAQYLYQSTTNRTKKAAYARLASALGTFLADAEAAGWGNSWNYEKVINHYFTTNDLPKYANAGIPAADIYNIDYDVESNFYFGMEMRMDFMMPKGGMTGKDTNNDGESDYPMVFDFTGDDDVWVYIDDVLFLDLTGIHRHVGGKIDFVNGVVYYYSLDTTDGEVADSAYKTYTFAQLLTAANKSTDVLNEKGTFKDYTTHSFDFFYMERGSGSSVCRINFNFPLLRRNSISVEKELTVNGSADTSFITNIHNLDFYFQIMKSDNSAPFIGEGTYYYLYDSAGNLFGNGYVTDADGKLISGPYKTGTGGVFTLKAGQKAVFPGILENAGKYYVRELFDPDAYPQYGTISVNGGTITQSTNNVQIGQNTFVGYNSPVYDASTGAATAFTFHNDITPSKLGSLRITKQVPTGQQTSGTFVMDVTLDGMPLPYGTVYTLNTETKTVTSPGQISLGVGDTVVIPNILLGTDYVVTEAADSATGFVVSYQNNTGTISKNTQNVQVVVTNALTAYRLPETGGSGTQWYYTGGLLLMATAGVLLRHRHRRRRT